MSIYDMSQWVLLFFIYSFAGWIWECLYVSVLKRKWVNRGFLNGPALPIYGFGAVIILGITLPFRDNLILVFFAGMAGATALEFVTGFLMEKIFGMRYWDYTGDFGNVKGYICVKASLCWGVFSILLVKVIHRPLDSLLLRLPEWLVHTIVGLSLLAFVYDVVISVRQAIDLKQFLEAQLAHNEKLMQLQEKLHELKEMELEDVIEDAKEEIARAKEAFEEKWEVRKGRALHILKRNPSAGSKRLHIHVEELRRFLER